MSFALRSMFSGLLETWLRGWKDFGVVPSEGTAWRIHDVSTSQHLERFCMENECVGGVC